MESAIQFTLNLADSLTKITLEEFFKSVHAKFYHTLDISFMGYFLELTKSDGQFVVEHQKLWQVENSSC